MRRNRIYDISNECYLFLESEYNKKFREELTNILVERNIIPSNKINLTQIDKYVIDKSMLDVDVTCGLNKISLDLYETSDKFEKLYVEFLKNLRTKVGFNFYFQKTPTIRVHCPNENCDIFFPRYHSDCFFGHPPEEINIWFSLTKNEHSGFYFLDYEKSTQWFSEVNNNPDLFIEKIENDPTFKKRGDSLGFEIESTDEKIFLFDSYCIHSNQPRKNDCRISIDIRINPVDDFVEGYGGNGRMRAEFKPGGLKGYSIKSIDQYIVQ